MVGVSLVTFFAKKVTYPQGFQFSTGGIPQRVLKNGGFRVFNKNLHRLFKSLNGRFSASLSGAAEFSTELTAPTTTTTIVNSFCEQGRLERAAYPGKQQPRRWKTRNRENIKKNLNIKVSKDESDQKNRWNLLDYGDVIVHILHNEERELYALEKFWNHALKVERNTWLENSKEFAKFDNN